MQWIRLVFVGAVALWISGLEGCGGKVVIDAESTGGNGLGGAGGSGGAGGGGGSSSSSSGGNTCVEGVCTGTDAACDCSATCSGTEVKATCFATGTSFTCACTINGTITNKCEGMAGTFACDVKLGCCAQFFP